MWTVEPPAAEKSASKKSGYAGSRACEGCHTFIYNQWRTTRHSFSVKTAHEAEEAGYPLPQPRQGGANLEVRSWDDVSYVIGGRQWIAYADASGNVLDTAYHHRIGRWDAFPTKSMVVCGKCHYTGFGAGPEHPENRVLPGRWAERNITCEACHGPGAKHVASLEKADIRADSSSRVCGQCHTAVGKILPKGELHATHDLVQGWNQDRHVTGVRSNSDNAFCARCHAPAQGYFRESNEGSRHKVFSEDKQNITCIGCHNPHQLTNARYRRDQAVLTSPLPIRSHTFEGNDEDITTTDHKEQESTEAVCIRCHRGADRIDLNHANASCNDCHNTFKRNHGRESRLLHDVNHPALSCRGCHADADNLMSILYRDPEFLAPKHIHNLRTLPARARDKYGFRYTQLIPSEVLATSHAPEPNAAAEPEDTRTRTASRPTTAPLPFLKNQPHRRLAEDSAVADRQQALIAAPDSIGRYLELAELYAGQSEFAAAREAVEYGLERDSSRILLVMPFGKDNKDGGKQTGDAPKARARALLPHSEGGGAAFLRKWLQGYLELLEGRFAAAAQSLSAARELRADSASLGFHAALAELGQRRYREALAALQENLQAYPDHRASQVGIGFVQLARRRSVPAIEALKRSTSDGPADAVAFYVLGRAYVNGRDMANAVQALQTAVTADPDLLLAWFTLAHAYRLGGRPDAAAHIYREIIRRRPRVFEAHFELASVLKLVSDRIAFQLQFERETRASGDSGLGDRRNRLSDWAQEVAKYRNLALSEFAIASSLRPSVPEVVRQVAEIYRRSGRLSEAARFFRWLAQRQPDLWLHRYRLGIIQFEQQHYVEAIETLTRVLEMAPTDGDSYLALGLAQIRAGRLGAAIETFERGTIYEPFNPALYTNLGAAYARRGNFARSRAALERSLELASFPLPRVHLTQTNLALVHLKEGRPGAARQALKRALHSYPEYSYARKLLEQLRAGNDWDAVAGPQAFVFNDFLERFGEVTTVTFRSE